ncbi:MAG: DUF2304 domain-containing protein [bacterium]|nr:DUF2304 domain-containing protein [bacterium]
MVAAPPTIVLSVRFLLLLAAIIGLFWVARRSQNRQLSRWAVFMWALLWVAVGFVSFIPELTNRLADFLGIGRGADVVIYAAIVVLLALLFRVSVRLEQLDRAITTVTRELALRDRDRGRP